VPEADEIKPLLDVLLTAATNFEEFAMKTIMGVFGAGIIGAALLASPAQAACAWNGYAWHCWNSRGAEIRSDRTRLRAEREDVRHDRRHMRHLRAKLNRDIYYGSSAQVVGDVRKMQRTHHRIQIDRQDVRGAREELREDRAGY
jgi:hypothetical protein